MFRTLRLVSVPLLAGVVAIAATGCSTPLYAQRNGTYRDVERRAYDTGYREGIAQGQNDVQRGRAYSYTGHSEYRAADDGWRRSDGDREFYRQSFRQGFQSGYSEAYNRYAANGRYPRSNYPNSSSYPTYPTYPERGVPRATYAPAAQNGYRDGFEAGRSDARDRNRYDPRRVKRYREGDQGYDRSYGNRDDYKRDYRSSFEQGYRDGFNGGTRRF